MSDQLISPLSSNALDIDSIKELIKQDLIDNNVITDINYEGSVISILVQEMAYLVLNINASHAMNANQTMLLLSSIRQNIIYLAQELGYKITRPVSAKMSVEFEVDTIDSGDSLTIPRLTSFDCGDYTFVLQDDVILNDSSLVVTGSIIEGTLLDSSTDENLQFNPDSDTTNFLLNYDNIENDNLFVKIKKSFESEFSENYDEVNSLVDITSDTFYSEIEPETRYVKVYTDFIGQGLTLTSDDTVDVTILLSNGSAANGIVDCSFTETDSFTSDLGVSKTVTVSVNGASSGGSDEESSESVQQNAPQFYNTGNRTVNKKDYTAFLNKNSLVEKSIVWGGESNIPVNLGHVYMSNVPQDENYKFLTNYEQSQVLQYLANPHIIAIGLIFIHPSYISMDYNINILGDLVLIDNKKSEITKTLETYFDEELSDFNPYYFENKVIRTIEDVFSSNDKASVSVTNSMHLNLYTEQFNRFSTDGEIKYYIPNSSRRYYLTDGVDVIDVPQDNYDLYSYYQNGWEKVELPDIDYNITFSGSIGGQVISEGSEESIVIDGDTYTKKDIILDTTGTIGYYILELDELIINVNIIGIILDGDQIDINYDNDINVVGMKNTLFELGNIVYT